MIPSEIEIKILTQHAIYCTLGSITVPENVKSGISRKYHNVKVFFKFTIASNAAQVKIKRPNILLCSCLFTQLLYLFPLKYFVF